MNSARKDTLKYGSCRQHKVYESAQKCAGKNTTKSAVLALAVLLAFALSGCGAGASEGKKDLRIFMTVNSIDTFRQTIVDAAEAKAAKEGIQLDVVDAHSSIEEQVAQIKKARAEEYDVILCSAVAGDTIVQLKMSAGDIPIIFFNSCPEEKHLSTGKYMYVGSNEQVAGQFQAEYVLGALSDRQEINVALIQGPLDHSATKGRTAGVKKVLEESGKKINYVFEDYADWDTEKARKVFGIFLRTGVPVDCVICNNDAMALGIVEACKNTGIKEGSIPILGVDATAAGCAAIQEGSMAFTVYQPGAGQGEAAVDLAIALAEGRSEKELRELAEDGRHVYIDFEKVDPQNAANYIK